MTAADPFTRACPLFANAHRGAVKSGPAFEWTGRGSLFSFRLQKRGGASASSLGSRPHLEQPK